MTTLRKLKNIKAAVINVWREQYFVFDPGGKVDKLNALSKTEEEWVAIGRTMQPDENEDGMLGNNSSNGKDFEL